MRENFLKMAHHTEITQNAPFIKMQVRRNSSNFVNILVTVFCQPGWKNIEMSYDFSAKRKVLGWQGPHIGI